MAWRSPGKLRPPAAARWRWRACTWRSAASRQTASFSRSGETRRLNEEGVQRVLQGHGQRDPRSARHQARAHDALEWRSGTDWRNAMTRRPPPRLARWLLQRFAFGPHRESLIGDIAEEYEQGRSSAMVPAASADDGAHRFGRSCAHTRVPCFAHVSSLSPSPCSSRRLDGCSSTTLAASAVITGSPSCSTWVYSDTAPWG